MPPVPRGSDRSNIPHAPAEGGAAPSGACSGRRGTVGRLPSAAASFVTVCRPTDTAIVTCRSPASRPSDRGPAPPPAQPAATAGVARMQPAAAATAAAAARAAAAVITAESAIPSSPAGPRPCTAMSRPGGSFVCALSPNFLQLRPHGFGRFSFWLQNREFCISLSPDFTESHPKLQSAYRQNRRSRGCLKIHSFVKRASRYTKLSILQPKRRPSVETPARAADRAVRALQLGFDCCAAANASSADAGRSGPQLQAGAGAAGARRRAVHGDQRARRMRACKSRRARDTQRTRSAWGRDGAKTAAQAGRRMPPVPSPPRRGGWRSRPTATSSRSAPP